MNMLAKVRKISIKAITAQLRAAQLADIGPHIGKIENIEQDLCDLAYYFGKSAFKFDTHFAVVRQIHAEAAHLPIDVLEAWQAEGPNAVHAALAKQFARLSKQGLLSVSDPSRASNQFIALVSFEVLTQSLWGARPVETSYLKQSVKDGVTAFLCVYQSK